MSLESLFKQLALAACDLPNTQNAGASIEALAAQGNMAREPTQQVAFRLSETLVKRLDRHVERMTSAHPGLNFSRADAVKSLLTRALDEVEDDDPLAKRRNAKGTSR